MDRLTIPDVKVDAHTTRRTMIDVEAVKERAMEIYWKLKKYEDTGLTPAEVLSMSAEWCAMMSVLNSIGSYDRLMELAKADKEGRVAVLPCRVGDGLWTFCTHPVEQVYSFTVTDISTLNGRTMLNTSRCGVIDARDVGKTVFLTREEAEKALEAKRNV